MRDIYLWLLTDGPKILDLRLVFCRQKESINYMNWAGYSAKIYLFRKKNIKNKKKYPNVTEKVFFPLPVPQLDFYRVGRFLLIDLYTGNFKFNV